MTDAPERIYTWVHRDGNRMTRVWHGEDGGSGSGKTEYLRADHALALVAEAYELAAEKCDARVEQCEREKPCPCYLRNCSIKNVIKRLTPSNALASRAARDKRVRDDALREAAEICTAAKDKRNKQRNDHPGESRDVKQRWMAGALQSQYNADAILALIEGDQNDE